MKFDNINKSTKIVVIISSIFIVLALILINNTKNHGYEPSIYSSIPLISWVLLIISIGCGIYISVNGVYKKEYEQNNSWVLGLFLIMLSDIIILSLPILRGYAWYGRGDPLYHLNWMSGIVSNGYIDLHYPITHIYIANFSLLSGVSLQILFKYIPLFFGIFFVLGMYLFTKSILPDKGQIILVTIASTFFVHGWYISLSPNHLSNLLLPFVLFILFMSYKSSSHFKLNYRLLLIIMIFLYGPFHPVAAIALLIMIIALSPANKMISALKISESIEKLNVITTSAILTIWTITWLSSFYVWESTIKNIYHVASEGGETAFDALTSSINYANTYGYDPMVMFFKAYAVILLYVICSVVAFFILIRKIKSVREYKEIFLLYGALIFFVLFVVLFYFLDLKFSPLRLLFYIVILSTLFVGFVLYELLEKARHNSKQFLLKTAFVFIVFIMIFSSVHGVLNLYESPYLLKYNSQLSSSEIGGVYFFAENRNDTIDQSMITSIDFSAKKGIRGILPPFHFNYTHNSLLGESYQDDNYMLLNKLDWLLYAEVWPEMAQLRWFIADFERLNMDNSIDKLYSNSGFDIWYINALREMETI